LQGFLLRVEISEIIRHEADEPDGPSIVTPATWATDPGGMAGDAESASVRNSQRGFTKYQVQETSDNRSMTYSVKEVFYTLQGEGAQAGRAAVFCRFSGCNLWTGRELDRDKAVCRFCDTDFVGTDGEGGGKFETADDLAAVISRTWLGAKSRLIGGAKKFVVMTGGEPLLQLDGDLIAALKLRNFEIAIETNGTLEAPPGIDWICVSPKAGSQLVQTSGQELKLVYPQQNAHPSQFEHLQFAHLFLQPMDGPDRDRNTRLAVAYCLENPRWRVSLQTHKLMGIP
jgi:7-carboxy-7-deazaguanine synthase